MKFLRAVIEDVQSRFNESRYIGRVPLESWGDASSCSCERMFSYVTATNHGHSTERMYGMLWVSGIGKTPEV